MRAWQLTEDVMLRMSVFIIPFDTSLFPTLQKNGVTWGILVSKNNNRREHLTARAGYCLYCLPDKMHADRAFGDHHRFLMEEGAQILRNLVDRRAVRVDQRKHERVLLCESSVLMEITSLLHAEGKRHVIALAYDFQYADILFRIMLLDQGFGNVQSDVDFCLVHCTPLHSIQLPAGGVALTVVVQTRTVHASVII